MRCLGLYVLVNLVLLISSRSLAAGRTNSYVYTGFNQPSLDLTVNDVGDIERNSEYHEILYEPELPTIAVIGASLGGWSFSLSQDIDSPGENSLDYSDYSLSLIYSWIGLDASYSEFVHFQITDQQGFDNELPVDEYSKEDMEIRFYSANFYLIPLRWNFAFDKAFDPSQAKTNGIGFGLIGSWNQTSIDSDFGLLPQAWKTAFGSDGSMISGDLVGTSVQLAIAGSLSLRPIYVSALLALGPGSHNFNYETANEERSGSGEQQIIRQKLALGAVGDSLFCAFLLNYESPDYLLKYMTLAPSRLETSALVGLKF